MARVCPPTSICVCFLVRIRFPGKGEKVPSLLPAAIASGWARRFASSRGPRILQLFEAAFHGLLEFGEVAADNGEVESGENLLLALPSQEEFERAPDELDGLNLLAGNALLIRRLHGHHMPRLRSSFGDTNAKLIWGALFDFDFRAHSELPGKAS